MYIISRLREFRACVPFLGCVSFFGCQLDTEHPVDDSQALTVGGVPRWKEPGSLNELRGTEFPLPPSPISTQVKNELLLFKLLYLKIVCYLTYPILKT